LAGVLEELGRIEEALIYVAPLLSAEPKVKAAHEIANLMLGGRTSGPLVAERLEDIADKLDGSTAASLLQFLIEAREETATMRDARRRWYKRAVVLQPCTLSLSSIIAGVGEMPDELTLWDAAEAKARQDGELGAVVEAYGKAILEGDAEGLRASSGDGTLAEE